MGMLGQHHVHTAEDFERWRDAGKRPITESEIEWLEDVNPCDCGLQPGEVKEGREL